MAKREIAAISVHQPWAWLIVNGYKDIENRSNPPAATKSMQRIAIHAPQRKVTRGEFEDFLETVKKFKIKRYPQSPEEFTYGAIVGTVFLVGAEKKSKSKWANRGCSHWKLEKPKKLKPKKMKGGQFWFTAKI